MLFPLSDDDRSLAQRGRAWVTLLLVVLNVFVFFVLQRGGESDFTYGYSVVPAEITTGQDIVGTTSIAVTDPMNGETVRVDLPQAPGPTPIYWTILTAMFMHGGLLHLGGNMLYLWIFGDNVEHRFGHVPFLLIYLACGLAATFAQLATDPMGLIPNLGASGAISGVMGAYLMLFPFNRVRVLLFIFVIWVPAYVLLGMWIATQVLNGYGASVLSDETGGGVAYMAHIGGFVTGMLLALLLRNRIPNRLAAPPPLSAGPVR